MSERASITDSGERRTFGSGAVRDRGTLKPRPDLISPHANTAEGWVLAEGAVKYDARNWEKGIPISECLASTMRHLEAFKLGQQDEPHLAQARTNIGFILHYLGEIEAGRMDPSIDDMPKYEDRENPVFAVTWPKRAAGLVVHKPAPEEKKGVTRQDLDDLVLLTCEYYPRPKPRPTVYVAGPMRGIPLYNFPAFDAARDQWAQCYNVISPADLDRANGFDPGDDHSPELTVDQLAEVMRRDILAILKLRPERGDGIAVLPGWEASRGARVEVALAVFLGLKVWDAITGTEVEIG